MPKKYAYFRVASPSQNVDEQIADVEKHGVAPSECFIDRQDCKEYERLKALLKTKDMLVLQSLDSLGDNYQTITEEWRYLTDRGIDIIVCNIPVLSKSHLSIEISKTINELVFQLLSFVAQNEPAMLKERKKSGIANAKAKGIHLGRPKLNLPKNFAVETEKYLRNEQSLAITLKNLNISKSSFYKYRKEN